MFDTGDQPQTPIGSTEVDLREVSETVYDAEEVDDVIYVWELEPETAGILIQEGHQARVEWDIDHRGQASISYRYENTCGSTAL